MKKHKKGIRVFLISLVSTVAVLAVATGLGLWYIMANGGFVSYSKPANMRKGDALSSAQAIVLATPTGNESFTKKRPDDTVEFRLVEMNVTEVISGDTSGTIRILQTVGWEEDPPLRMGNTYLLFLDAYEGGSIIPDTQGSYVVISGGWGYYQVSGHTVTALYDEMGETQQWLNSFAARKPASFQSDAKNGGSYTVLDWLREQNP